MRTSTLDASARWLNRALLLAWITIVYNVVEGLVSVGFGFADDSLSLFGFGIDSFIESASGVMVLWRLRGEVDDRLSRSVGRERLATLIVGMLLVLLAIGTATGAVLLLHAHRHPDTTVPGLAVAVVSIALMWWLWSAKRRTATETGSTTLAADAACSMSCIQLSVVLLLGSVLYMIPPAWWWADSIAAIGIALLILREGMETVRNALSKNSIAGCCGGCHSSD